MNYIANAFSLNMVSCPEYTVRVIAISSEDMSLLAQAYGMQSAIGHADTALAVSIHLGIDLPPNRISLSLSKGDILYVAQYIGERLPEGTTQLPEGAKLQYKLIHIE